MTPLQQMRADKAWTAVRKAISKHGLYTSVDFDDNGCINAAIRRTGGWMRLCCSKESTFETSVKHRFMLAYADVLDRGCELHETAYLRGGHERASGAFPCGAQGPEVVVTGLRED